MSDWKEVARERKTTALVQAMDTADLVVAFHGYQDRIEALEAGVERLRVDLGRARARPYLQTPIAWSGEDGDLCVLGTHDRQRAHAAVMAYLEETGNSGDEEWDAWASNPAAIGNGERLFVDPLVVEDEDWPRTSLSAEPQREWLPYLFARCP